MYMKSNIGKQSQRKNEMKKKNKKYINDSYDDASQPQPQHVHMRAVEGVDALCMSTLNLENLLLTTASGTFYLTANTRLVLYICTYI